MAADPRVPEYLLFLKEHPKMTYLEVEKHFGLKRGCLAVWVQRARQRTEPKPPPVMGAPLPPLVLLRDVHIPRTQPATTAPLPAPPATTAPLPAPPAKAPRNVISPGVIARHRALIDRQLTYLENQDLGTKEYLTTHTVYRGLLADWMALPAIDSEKAPSNVPDVSTEEGLAAAAALIASLPEELLQAALSLSCKENHAK